LKVLRIHDWGKHFENNRTRELKKMEWIPIPNKHDGDGFTELMDAENSVAYFGAWVLILQVASKCDPRGTLLRDCAAGGKTPHTPDTLARVTRGDPVIFAEAIDKLISIGWIETCEFVAPSRGEVAPSRGEVPMEWNGMEGNGMEWKTTTGSSDFIESFKTLSSFKPFQSITPDQWEIVLRKRNPFLDVKDAATWIVQKAKIAGRIAKPGPFIDAHLGYYATDHGSQTLEREKVWKERKTMIEETIQFVADCQKNGEDRRINCSPRTYGDAKGEAIARLLSKFGEGAVQEVLEAAGTGKATQGKGGT
jgi:hypothetical protein